MLQLTCIGGLVASAISRKANVGSKWQDGKIGPWVNIIIYNPIVETSHTQHPSCTCKLVARPIYNQKFLFFFRMWHALQPSCIGGLLVSPTLKHNDTCHTMLCMYFSRKILFTFNAIDP